MAEDRLIVQFRPGPLRRSLASRKGKRTMGAVAREDLRRYYEAMKRARAIVESRLSEDEIAAVVEAMRDVYFDPLTLDLMWSRVDDSVRFNHLTEQWPIDGAQLVERLRKLTYWEKLALIDLAERYWATEPESVTLEALQVVMLGDNE